MGDKKHTPLARADGSGVQNGVENGWLWLQVYPYVHQWRRHCICTIVHMKCEYFSTTDMTDK